MPLTKRSRCLEIQMRVDRRGSKTLVTLWFSGIGQLDTADFDESIILLPQASVFSDQPDSIDRMTISAQGTPVVVCAIAAPAVAAFVVVLRFITRWRILRFVGPEDWCITAALFFSVTNGLWNYYQADYALGKHISTLSAWDIRMFLKAVYFSIFSYNMSLTMSKVSTLLLYLRIFHTKTTKKICHYLMGFVVVNGLWLLLSSVVACVPLAAFWDNEIEGHCLPSSAKWILNASINIATDIGIFILPMPMISTLALPMRQKLGLYFVFGLGFFVCIMSVLRLHSLAIEAETGMHGDYTWDNTGLTNWSCVELNMAIICPSLSTLKPLLSHLFPRLFSTSSSRTTNGTHGNGMEGISRTRTRRGPAESRISRPEVVESSDEESLRTPVSFELGQMDEDVTDSGSKAGSTFSTIERGESHKYSLHSPV